MWKDRILAIVLVVLLCGAVAFATSRAMRGDKYMLSQKVDAVERVIVTRAPMTVDECAAELFEPEEMEALFDVIEKTNKIHMTAVEEEEEPIENDVTFSIEIYYRDGMTDYLFLTEEEDAVYRFVLTSDEELRYAVGRNTELRSALESLDGYSRIVTE